MAQFKLLFSDRAKCFSATHPFSGDIGKIIVFDPRKQEILFEPMISNLRYNKDKILINEFDYKDRHYISKYALLTTRGDIRKRRDEKLGVDEPYIIQRKKRKRYSWEDIDPSFNDSICNIYIPIDDAKVSNIHYKINRKSDLISVSYHAEFDAFTPVFEFDAEIGTINSDRELYELYELSQTMKEDMEYFFDTEESTLENCKDFYKLARKIHFLSKKIVRNREKRMLLTNEEIITLVENNYAKEYDSYSKGHAYPPPFDGSAMPIVEIKEEN